MQWLDPRVRCNRCGAVLSGSQTHCPSCAAELADVGTQSELREWDQIRRQGRARFVWGWAFRGGLVGAIFCAVYAWRGEDDPVLYALTALWPIGGYAIGRWHWRGAEREYATSVGRKEPA
jgi:hypothetical protein